MRLKKMRLVCVGVAVSFTVASSPASTSAMGSTKEVTQPVIEKSESSAQSPGLLAMFHELNGFHEWEWQKKESTFLELPLWEKYEFLRIYGLYFILAAEKDADLSREALEEVLDTYLLLGNLYWEEDPLSQKQRLISAEEKIGEDLGNFDIWGKLSDERRKHLSSCLQLGKLFQEREKEEIQDETSAMERELFIPMVRLLVNPPQEGEEDGWKERFHNLYDSDPAAETEVDPLPQVKEEQSPSEEREPERETSNRNSGKPVQAAKAYPIGWNSDSGGWWYAYSTTEYYKNCWKYLSYQGVYDWYYFKDSGYIATNTWIDSNNYVNASGFCTIAGIGSFKNLKMAAASGHCTTARMTAGSVKNEEELRITKQFTVTTAQGTDTCTIFGTGVKRWVVTGSLTLEGNLTFEGQKNSVANDVTSNLYVKAGGALMVQSPKINIQNSIGHGIYGEPESRIEVQDGNIWGNYNDGIGTYGRLMVTGGKFFQNDTGIYIAGTFDGRQTGGRGTLTGGEYYQNNYGIASSEHATFEIGNVSVHHNTRYGFVLYPNGTATLEGKGEFTSNQCGIYNRGNTVFSNGTVQENKNTGILNEGKFTFKDGRILKNKGTDGAGVHNKKEFTLVGGRIESNQASSRGGGICNKGTMKVTAGAIRGNRAASMGGGICNEGSLEISGGEISKNQALYGGGLENLRSLTVRGGVVSENTGTTGGGGINNDGALEITKGDFVKNSSGNGAGIRCGKDVSTLKLTGGVVAENNASGNGGGLSILYGSYCEIANSQIRSNRAARGTEIYLDGVLKAGDRVSLDKDIFLAPARFILAAGKVSSFICALGAEDTSQGRVLAHYTGVREDGESEKFSLEPETEKTASARYLAVEGGKVKGAAYPYSVYLNTAACQIRYLPNGGEGEMEPDTVPLKKVYSLRNNEFTREGASFAGWAVSPKEPVRGALYAPGTTMIPEEFLTLFSGERRHRDMILYAVWDLAPRIEGCGLEFYEGEVVGREEITQGLLLTHDEEDGQITASTIISELIYGPIQNGYRGSEVQFEQGMPSSYLLDTYGEQGMKKGERAEHRVTYLAADSSGNTTSKNETIYVQFNEAPRLSLPELLLFTKEEAIQGKITEEEVLAYAGAGDKEDDMAKALGLKDKNGQEIDIRNGLAITQVIGPAGVLPLEEMKTPGRYQVSLEVTDRFGKSDKGTITIEIMEENQREETCLIRFISREYLDTLSEDSQWEKEELEDRLENKSPRYTIQLSAKDLREIRSKAKAYGTNKTSTEQAIKEIVKILESR